MARDPRGSLFYGVRIRQGDAACAGWRRTVMPRRWWRRTCRHTPGICAVPRSAPRNATTAWRPDGVSANGPLRSWPAVIAVVAAVAVVFAVAVVPHLDTASTGERTVTDAPGVASGSGTTGGESDDGIQIARAVPAPDHLEGVYDGDDVTFTWHNPDPAGRRRLRVDHNGRRRGRAECAVRDHRGDVGDPCRMSPARRICLSVSIVRQDQSMSQEPAIACAVKR